MKISSIAFWATVLFSWDFAQTPGTDAPTGFKVAWGTTSKQYTSSIDVPGGNSRSVTVPNLDLSKPIFAALVAYNQWGTLSAPSNEIQFGGPVATPIFLKVEPALK